MPQEKFKLLALPSFKNVAQAIKKFPFAIELTNGKFNDLEFIFQKGRIAILREGVDLKEFSFVWLSSAWTSRDLAYAVRLYLKNSGTPHSYVEKGTSKITDQMIYSLNSIRTPDTLFIGRNTVEKNFSLINKICGYPVIVKDTKGSRGHHSIIINSEDELLEKIKQLPKHKKYLFQRYIPNEYDWGILVANGKVVSGEKSYSCDGEFRNNTCNGAKEVFVDPCDIPEQVKQMALKTSKVLGLFWSRSDIIIDKNTQIPYLMEINRRPGITSESTEVSGAYAFLSSQISHLVK
ncbi:MAG: hypothetical protein U5L10_05085 [Candidatus Moranbacteria bacterium]|nr:hypothetical protein [Candidatus Moranbacteria bacterium]